MIKPKNRLMSRPCLILHNCAEQHFHGGRGRQISGTPARDQPGYSTSQHVTEQKGCDESRFHVVTVPTKADTMLK